MSGRGGLYEYGGDDLHGDGREEVYSSWKRIICCPNGHSRAFTAYGIGLYECHDCLREWARSYPRCFMIRNRKSEWTSGPQKEESKP